MENFFLDNEDLLFQLEHMDLERIVQLYEDDYSEAAKYPFAPKDYADARDNYKRVIEIAGQIAAEYMAPFAPEVDETGVKLVDGEVTMAAPTVKAWEMLAKAELTGMTFARKNGGLNIPLTVLSMVGEIMSRADASFLNLGLQQDIGDTLERFGSEEQIARIVPILASGAQGSAMILTEPDAGSDLQAVTLRATQKEDGSWVLNGVKRFITNGCGRIGLVLARSEDRDGARGLSMFLYERGKETRIRRVEEKLGIHGSPTCEMQFNNAPAELVGERGRGLTKYTMWLMNSARLSVASQGVGIGEAAYREAEKYARERCQFGLPIIKMPAVYEMLAEMRIAVEAGRSLLYETARVVDLKEGLERISEHHPEKAAELKGDIKKYVRYAAFFTPIAKMYNSEMANKVAYDAIQIHGGTGFMKDFNVERHYRDARITNIYEGTTQLQVVAAIGGVMAGTALAVIDEYAAEDWNGCSADLLKTMEKGRDTLDKSILQVKEMGGQDVLDFHARRLVEMATDLVMAWLLLRDARHSPRKMRIAETFIEKMQVRIKGHAEYIASEGAFFMKNYKEILQLGE
ncbi:MAG: acyl-CoA dehydrogenase family protein [Spirochaetes bacterium]|nr:acyl-CoA dehydrogenase family protein [Spirochaetota bacterium]